MDCKSNLIFTHTKYLFLKNLKKFYEPVDLERTNPLVTSNKSYKGLK